MRRGEGGGVCYLYLPIGASASYISGHVPAEAPGGRETLGIGVKSYFIPSINLASEQPNF